MVASLMLAATMARSWFPGVAYADLVTCPGNHHMKPPPLYSFMPPYLPDPRKLDAVKNAKATITTVSDLITYPDTGAAWFQSYAGGGGAGTFAVYDTVDGVYATCSYEDTAHELQYFRVPSREIPTKIPRRELHVNVRTERGIRLGDTLAAVEAVYGPPHLIHLTRLYWIASYTKIGPQEGSLHFVTNTTFFFRDGRLAGIDRVSGI
jgi:hypothetical protein